MTRARATLRFIQVWASVTVFTIVTSAAFVPIDLGRGLEYLFIPPEWPTIAAAIAAIGAGLAVAVLVVDRLARRHGPDRLVETRRLRWLTPASVAGLVVLGIAPALPGVGERGAVLAYVFYDLRWWWAAMAIGGVVWRLRNSAVALPTAAPDRSVVHGFALFALVIAWTIVTTPHLRWSGGLHGDEPKYLRYSDAIAQGHGFDVSSRIAYREQAPDARPAWLGNLRALAQAIVTDVRALPGDLRSFASDPFGFRWNRVSGADGFFTGRHGGVYQIHPPGLSLLLVPGYTIDRYLLGGEPGYQGEFPSRLVMTTTTLLVLLGGCAIVLYGLLMRALANVALAWTGAAIGTLMLPLSAFGFQIYPEVPAALLILIVVRAVLAGPRGPVLYGAAGAAAALVWLHPRLMIVSAVLVALAFVRADRAGRRAVVAIAAAVFATFCGYNYHATGSAWPLAVFDVFASEVSVSLSRVPLNLLAYAFDRTWGVFAHSPLLLVAPAGLALMWRRDRLSVIGIVAIVLAAAVPAAAHTLSAAGGTPGRLVASVTPLLIWPVAVFVRRAWTSRVFAALIVLLAVITLDNAISYNLDHAKNYGPLRDWSGVGWKLHQMFPAIRGEVWETSWLNFSVLLALLAAEIGLVIWGLREADRGSDARLEAPMITAQSAGLVLAGCIVVATIATAAMGQWTRGDYLPRPGMALMTAAEALASRDSCRGCLSSRGVSLQWRDLQPSVDRFRVDTETAADTLIVRVSLESDAGRAGLARVRVEYGDGSESPWTAVLDRRELQHRYARPGRYEIVTWVEWGAGGHRMDRRTIEVSASAGGRPAF